MAVALFALAVISIVGLVLLGVVRESAVRTASTEAAVRAEMLAQSGLDRVLAQIRKVADDVNNAGLVYRDAVALASSRLDAVDAWDGKEYTVQGGKYRLEVLENRETSNPAGRPETDPDVPYVRKIVVRSIGSFDRRPSVSVAKTMTVYVGTVHPVFRYPVSARGDLSLNGSPYIVGDVLVRDGDLRVANEAQVISAPGSLYGFISDFPALRGFIRVDGRTPGSDRFFKSETSGPYSRTTHSSRDFDVGYFSSQMFPFEDLSLESDDPELRPADYVARKSSVFAMREGQSFDLDWPEGEFEHVVSSDTDWLSGSVRFSNTSLVIDGSVLTVGTSSSSSADLLIKEGSLRLQRTGGARVPELRLQNGSLFVQLTAPQQIAADLSGKIVLPPDKFAYIEGDVFFNDGFELSDGSMYIKGNLTIFGDIRLRGTVYVDGDVDLKRMRSINGLSGGTPIPLVLVASSNVVLGDNTNERNADAEIRAFLFSKRQVKMYGVVSKLFISGGIHGENPGGTAVELHAVRGEPPSMGGEPPIEYAGPSWPGPNIQPDQEVLPFETSRLQIYHDALLYEQPPTGIPITEGLNIFVAKVERG